MRITFSSFGESVFRMPAVFVANVGFDYRIHRRPYPAVFDQIAESRFAVAAHRRFE